MKRAFAIIIVVLLGLGMVGLFFPYFLQQPAAPQQQAPTGTSASLTASTTLPSALPGKY